MSKPKWQTLTESGDETTEVLRLPGAWLYRTTRWRDDWRNDLYVGRVPAAVGLVIREERS